MPGLPMGLRAWISFFTTYVCQNLGASQAILVLIMSRILLLSDHVAPNIMVVSVLPRPPSLRDGNMYTYRVGSDRFTRASELAQSVYGLLHKGTTRRILRKVNAAGKITAIVIPLIIILLLRAPPVQKDPLVFTVITDIPCKSLQRVDFFATCSYLSVGLAMGLGSILMLVILGRYIYSRRKLLRFDAGQGASTDPESQTSSSNAGSRYSRYSRATKPKRNRVIYDRWIMTRFTAAFFFLWYVCVPRYLV